MIYAKLTKEEIEEIEAELEQTKDVKWYKRLKVVHLSSQGKTVPELAEMFDLCQSTVRNYIKRYNEGKLAGLRPDYDQTRYVVKLTLDKATVENILKQSPSQFDKLETEERNWTQALFVTYLVVYHAIEVTQTGVSKFLKRLGIRWKRAKLKVTSPDPLYEVKRERVEELKKKAEEGTLNSHDQTDADISQPPKPAVLVYFDPTELHWCPEVGYGYAPDSDQIKIGTPGVANPCMVCFIGVSVLS